MPPKQRITKEILLEHAFQIAGTDGISAVTSRSVAKSAGCSIQPVFSQFPTMEQLRQATFDFACGKFMDEVLDFEKQPGFFENIVLWTIDLARNRPHLYRLLYLSGGFQGKTFVDAMMRYESNQKIIARMATRYGLRAESCKDILMRSCLFLLGIGTMICENHISYTNEQVLGMVKQTVADMVQGAKRGTL
ncbi:MAG: TetR family transcriptional regulator [Oscillospiraceae bacterium]|nr:TetR family transcriptional regulator [Oscillospiraceae bacterium]